MRLLLKDVIIMEQVKQILDEEMRHAADLSVDLEVDMNVGDNWYEAH